MSSIPKISDSFVSQDCSHSKPRSLSGTTFAVKTTLSDSANDWKLLIDYDQENIVFPPEIYGTPERPDITLWCYAARKVILIELTCPSEEGIHAAKTRKLKKYSKLVPTFRKVGVPLS